MSLRLSFSWIGLAVFALPMLINIVYAVFPPVGDTSSGSVSRWAEAVENISRIAYLLAVVFLVSSKPVRTESVWLYLAAVFLVLYYAVWIRYFAGGREVSLLGKRFLSVPMPLAVFPVIYYISAAVWMHNIPAAVIMVIFGAAHITVSVQSFR